VESAAPAVVRQPTRRRGERCQSNKVVERASARSRPSLQHCLHADQCEGTSRQREAMISQRGLANSEAQETGKQSR
jgi:hypothetical protein